MPTIKLTDLTIKSLKTRPGDRQTEWWDDNFTGASFGVRVGQRTTTGVYTKQFMLMYRNAQGERRRISLGSYPIISLSEAKQKARAVLGQVAEGEDPAEKKRQYMASDTFGQLCEQFLVRHASQKKARTQYEYRRIINKHLVPAWGNWKVQDITKKHALALVDGIADTSPVMANNVRALISKIFNFGMRKDIVQYNPVHQTDRPAKDNRRTRVLSDEEIKAFWAKCEVLEPPIANLFKLILLTGQRPGEVKSMRWEDITHERWIIPADIAKNGRQHVVPLSPLALKILADQRSKGELHLVTTQHPGFLASIPIYAFYSDTGSSIEWLTKAINRINEACSFKERFTAHDLRRTAATGMASVGVSREIIAAVLNHKTADNVVTARYDLYDRIEEKKKALVRWAKHVQLLVSEKDTQPKVVALRPHSRL